MEHYSSFNYDNAERFDVYKTQVRLLEEQCFENVLEFGVGSGFLKRYLVSKGKDVFSVDINKELLPDKVCKIEDYNKDVVWDVVTCFQVLEYVQEKDLDRVLKMLGESGKKVIISIPYQSWFCKINLKLPFCRFELAKVLHLQKLGKCVPYRKWMLGTDKHSWKWFEQLLISNGLVIEKKGCFFPDALHYYFVVRKRYEHDDNC